jgi:hypothetical protein
MTAMRFPTALSKALCEASGVHTFQAFLDSGRGFGPVTSEQVDAVKVILDDMYDMDQRWYSGLA